MVLTLALSQVRDEDGLKASYIEGALRKVDKVIKTWKEGPLSQVSIFCFVIMLWTCCYVSLLA